MIDRKAAAKWIPAGACHRARRRRDPVAAYGQLFATGARRLPRPAGRPNAVTAWSLPRGCAIVPCPASGDDRTVSKMAYSGGSGYARSGPMPNTKTYTGGCHCGQVRFQWTIDLAVVTACNCSICTKKGLHFTFVAPNSFQLRAGEDNLKEYLFNKHAIRHQLCIDCGVDVFARGSKPDGTEVVALNVSCIDGIELAKLAMTPIDGRNR